MTLCHVKNGFETVMICIGNIHESIKLWKPGDEVYASEDKAIKGWNTVSTHVPH